jgi:hypothetical protein
MRRIGIPTAHDLCIGYILGRIRKKTPLELHTLLHHVTVHVTHKNCVQKLNLMKCAACKPVRRSCKAENENLDNKGRKRLVNFRRCQ